MIFLALETYTFSRPRTGNLAVDVILAGAVGLLVALTATFAFAGRTQRVF